MLFKSLLLLLFILLPKGIKLFSKEITNGKFEELELNGDSYTAYIENGGFEKLNKHIATIQNI